MLRDARIELDSCIQSGFDRGEGGGGGTYHGFVIGFFVDVVGRSIAWWYDEYE